VIYIAQPSFDDIVLERRTFNVGIFVPINAYQVIYNVESFAFNASDSPCEDPDVKFSGGGRGVGCWEAGGDYPGTSIVPCLDYSENFVTLGDNITFDNAAANDGSGIADLAFGTWWFFSTQPDTFDDDNTCKFGITVTVLTCPVGQVSVANEGSNPSCVTPITIYANGTNIRFNNTGTAVFVATLANPADAIVLSYNTTDGGDVTVSMWPNAAVREVNNDFCTFTSDFTDVFTCFSIPSGLFYITVETDNLAGGDSILNILAQTCPAGTGGINCASSVVAWNSSLTGGSLPADVGSVSPGHLYYIDFAQNTSVSLNISIIQPNGGSGSPDGRVFLKKGMWPFVGGDGNGFDIYFGDDDESFDTVTPVVIYFRPEDSYMGGRFWFAVINEGIDPVNYTFSSSVFVSSSTGVTGVSTSGSVSTGASATGASATGASATGASATGASATGASATGATATGATATGATATGATSSKATTGSTTKSSASTVAVSAVVILATILALIF